MGVALLLDKLDALGISLTIEGEKLRLQPGSKVPPEMVEELRQQRIELIEEQRSRDKRQPSLFDIPFPLGFGGLLRAQVEIAEVVNNRLGITDPVLRKYNVISHVRGYYQDLNLNHGKHYEALKLEQERLGRILDEGGW